MNGPISRCPAVLIQAFNWISKIGMIFLGKLEISNWSNNDNFYFGWNSTVLRLIIIMAIIMMFILVITIILILIIFIIIIIMIIITILDITIIISK